MLKNWCFIAFLVILLGLPCCSYGQSGNIIVTVNTTNVTNAVQGDIVWRVEQVISNFSIIQWNDSQLVDQNTQWSSVAVNNGSWYLVNNYNDIVLLTPQQSGLDVPRILSTIANTPFGVKTTVGDNIGYSISQTRQNSTGAPAQNEASNVNTTSVNILNNAANIVDQSSTNATQKAIVNIENAARSTAANAALVLPLIDNTYRSALQNLKDIYNAALSGFESSSNKPIADLQNVPRKAQVEILLTTTDKTFQAPEKIRLSRPKIILLISR